MMLDKELLIKIVKSIDLELLGDWIDLCANTYKNEV